MKHYLVVITGVLFVSLSCTRIKSTAKETLNKGGEVVGKSATEFVEGVTEGVERTLDCSVMISEELTNKGISTGKYFIDNDNGVNNKLTLYVISDKEFKGRLSVKVFDKAELECGRRYVDVSFNAGEARYIDFVFDKRTSIEVRSKITIE
jgi:hypothetical protein